MPTPALVEIAHPGFKVLSRPQEVGDLVVRQLAKEHQVEDKLIHEIVVDTLTHLCILSGVEVLTVITDNDGVCQVTAKALNMVRQFFGGTAVDNFVREECFQQMDESRVDIASNAF